MGINPARILVPRWACWGGLGVVLAVLVACGGSSHHWTGLTDATPTRTRTLVDGFVFVPSRARLPAGKLGVEVPYAQLRAYRLPRTEGDAPLAEGQADASGFYSIAGLPFNEPLLIEAEDPLPTPDNPARRLANLVSFAADRPETHRDLVDATTIAAVAVEQRRVTTPLSESQVATLSEKADKLIAEDAALAATDLTATANEAILRSAVNTFARDSFGALELRLFSDPVTTATVFVNGARIGQVSTASVDSPTATIEALAVDNVPIGDVRVRVEAPGQRVDSFVVAVPPNETVVVSRVLFAPSSPIDEWLQGMTLTPDTLPSSGGNVHVEVTFAGEALDGWAWVEPSDLSWSAGWAASPRSPEEGDWEMASYGPSSDDQIAAAPGAGRLTVEAGGRFSFQFPDGTRYEGKLVMPVFPTSGSTHLGYEIAASTGSGPPVGTVGVCFFRYVAGFEYVEEGFRLENLPGPQDKRSAYFRRNGPLGGLNRAAAVAGRTPLERIDAHHYAAELTVAPNTYQFDSGSEVWVLCWATQDPSKTAVLRDWVAIAGAFRPAQPGPNAAGGPMMFRLLGAVYGSGQQPVASAHLVIQNVGVDLIGSGTSGTRRVDTGPDGRFDVDLPAGLYSVWADDDVLGSVEQLVYGPPGTTQSVELRLVSDPRPFIDLRVRDAAGRPRAGADYGLWYYWGAFGGPDLAMLPTEHGSSPIVATDEHGEAEVPLDPSSTSSSSTVYWVELQTDFVPGQDQRDDRLYPKVESDHFTWQPDPDTPLGWSGPWSGHHLVELTQPEMRLGNVVWSDDFEVDHGWSGSGLWHRQQNDVGAHNHALPGFVRLAPGDPSDGRIPPAYGGSNCWWFGDPATGNYLGEQVPGDIAQSGGTSVAEQHGELVSPIIDVSDCDYVRVRWAEWFEFGPDQPEDFVYTHNDGYNIGVESFTANGNPDWPHVADQNDHWVVAGGNPTDLFELFTSPYPRTSGGPAQAPLWTHRYLDLALRHVRNDRSPMLDHFPAPDTSGGARQRASGNRRLLDPTLLGWEYVDIGQLRLSFLVHTNRKHNGYRGLFIDDVEVLAWRPVAGNTRSRRTTRQRR